MNSVSHRESHRLLKNRTMKRHTAKIPFLWLALVAAGNTTFAFQLEVDLLSQALLQNPSLSSIASLDELLFVAANLLETATTPSSPSRLFPPSQTTTAAAAAASTPPPLPQDIRATFSQFQPALLAGDEEFLFDYDYYTSTRTAKLQLTPEEKELFQLVRTVCQESCPGTTVRIAGGWVRDKLLHAKSSSSEGEMKSARDVDFVLNNMAGSEFAKKFQDYIQRHTPTENSAAACQSLPKTSSSSSATAKSPSTEHLQTATLDWGPFSLDFCRMRLEKYNSHSRVPEQTGMASTVEDAWRRDLTINSLYYNINTNQVEDWTEQGLQDLQLQIIATPMAAYPTLMEDPLRMLRAIRFAAQLSFSMDPALIKAARATTSDINKSDKNRQPKTVKSALQRKVSKDSIGNEMDILFQSRDPSRGIALLMESNLMDVVFPISFHDEERLSKTAKQHQQQKPKPALVQVYLYNAAFRLLSRTQALVNEIVTQQPTTTQPWDRRLLWYAAFFKVFHDTESRSRSSASNSSKRSRRLGSPFYHVLSLGLKRTKSDIQAIEGIVKGANTFYEFLQKNNKEQQQNGRGDSSPSRMQFVWDETKDLSVAIMSPHHPQWNEMMDLRWEMYQLIKPIGPHWREALILALAMSHQNNNIKQAHMDNDDAAALDYHKCMSWIQDRLCLDDTTLFHQKPLLNGSQIQEKLMALTGQSIPNGGKFRQIMAAQEEWQVRHYCPQNDDTNAPTTHNNNTVERREGKLMEYLVQRLSEYAVSVPQNNRS
jgi:tRNA nucleotidyltransferase/poly(A) polymerase